MVSIEKNDLVEKILRRQLGAHLFWTPPDDPPLLGPEYVQEIILVRERTHAFISKHRFILNAQDKSDLIDCYDGDGLALTNEIESYWRKIRGDDPFTERNYAIFSAGLGNPKFIADYEYWSRMEWIELKEALWLSMGLDPREDWSETLTYQSHRHKGHKRELAYANGLFEQLTRFSARVNPGRKRFKGPELLDWIETTRFPAHSGFVSMLRNKPMFTNGNESLPTESVPEPNKTRREDPRAVLAVAKIITAIAIEEFGYNPKDNRSPIPKEIEAIMDKLGLSGSAETVRKYLKIGAAELPDGWNGEQN